MKTRLALALLVAQLWLSPAPAAAEPPGNADGRDSPDFASALLRETSVVVSITTTPRAAQANLGFSPDSFAVPAQRPTSRDPWDRARRTDQDRGLASGIVISGDGEILTNAHAVADVERAVVRLADGRQFAGKVIGIDRTTDVALLKIEAHGLPTAAIGNSARVAAGEWVVAIGSPFGLDNSATAGIVSAAQRFLPGSAVPLIQSDVAINPGSSGGPLFNLRGEVIGINSMAFSLTGGGYMGVSFSVPIDLAIRIAADLRSTGRVSRGQLGAKIQEVTLELARSFGLPAAHGALVLRVVRDSPAQRSGLRSGDVVMGIDARVDSSYVQLQQDVAAARPGALLALNVWRQGAMQRVALTVGEAPADMPARPKGSDGQEGRLGLSLGEVPAARRERLGLDGGLSVLEARGAASQGGVQADDLIVAVGDCPVRDIAAFDAALAAAPGDRPVALLVLRAGTLAYLAIEQGH